MNIFEVNRTDRYIIEDVVEKLLSLSEEMQHEFLNCFAPEKTYIGEIYISKWVEVKCRSSQEQRNVEGDNEGIIEPSMMQYRIIKKKDLIEKLKELSKTNNQAKILLDRLEYFGTKEAFLSAEDDEKKRKELEDLFKILETDEALEDFIQKDGDINKVIALAKLLGDKYNDICNYHPIFLFDFINKNMLERYKKLRQRINIDMEMLGDEPFGEERGDAYSSEVQKIIDSSWEINEGLKRYLFEGMNPNYSLEEKISYIYIKLCYVLVYDTNFAHQTLGPIRSLNKKRQERISLERPQVMCRDFSRLCSKLFNEMSPDIEARCVAPDGWGHEACGILIRKHNIRINFEAINLREHFNDLGRAKLGLPLLGVDYIYDRDNLFKNSFNKVYQELQQIYQIPTEDLIEAYEHLPNTPEVKVDFDENIKSFLSRMKEKVSGNELLNVFVYLSNKLSYFGDINYYFINQYFNKKFTTNILIQEGERYFILRADSLTVEKYSKDELLKAFGEGAISFWDDRYVAEGFGGENDSR